MQGGHVDQLWQADATLSAGGRDPGIACGGGTIAGVLQSMVRAPALVAGALGAWHPVSHDNDRVAARWTARSVSWSDDGYTPDGWVLEPLAAPKGLRPLVTIVHGGPSAASLPAFPRRGVDTALLSAGYDLFLPNPRGSFGHGEAFAAADYRDLGDGPLRDILAGLDGVLRRFPVDPHRLGLFGYSYGGYMALWAPGRTDRFQASVSGAGISDWISLDGETGVEKADLALFGAPAFAAADLYLSQSPVLHARSVHTPVFLFGGDQDVECPIQQSLEFWHDLRDLHVPTEFVVYAGQGHGLENAHDLADSTRRTLAWFARYLGPSRRAAGQPSRRPASRVSQIAAPAPKPMTCRRSAPANPVEARAASVTSRPASASIGRRNAASPAAGSAARRRCRPAAAPGRRGAPRSRRPGWPRSRRPRRPGSSAATSRSGARAADAARRATAPAPGRPRARGWRMRPGSAAPRPARRSSSRRCRSRGRRGPGWSQAACASSRRRGSDLRVERSRAVRERPGLCPGPAKGRGPWIPFT